MTILDEILERIGIFWDAITQRSRCALMLATAVKTDRGLMRNDNQDAYLNIPNHHTIAVADGMGGGEGGALASKWTCEALEKAVVTAHNYKECEEKSKLAISAVNEHIHLYANENDYKMMGTTLAALFLEPTEGFQARICHVGDSRIYRLRHKRLDLLTRDHTVGKELEIKAFAEGNPNARKIGSRKNPQTHILTRAIGTEMYVRADWKTIDVHRGDRFLLCSDGVHDMIGNNLIQTLMQRALTPRALVATIEEAVRKAGASDNYTILAAFVVKKVSTIV